MIRIACLTALMSAIGTAGAAPGDQLFKLLDPTGATNDSFGRAVAIDSALAVVGAYQDDPQGSNSGSASLFNPFTGQFLAPLLPGDGAAGDQFGWSVAVSGSRTVVGANQDDDRGTDSGAVYIFNNNNGQQTAKVVPTDGQAGDLFGFSVAIDNNTIVIGARDDDDLANNAGSAYLYTRNGTFIAKLLAPDGAAGDGFGRAVAISGNNVVVGSREQDASGTDSGAAYLFNTSGQFLRKLVPSDGAAGDLFSRDVAIHDGLVVIGAHANDDNGSNSGSAYVFDAATGQQLAKLLPDDGAAGDVFGWSVAVHRPTILVGAWGNDGAAGVAYLFSETGEQLARVTPNDPGAEDNYTYAVALAADRAIIGSWHNDDLGPNSGSAYIVSADACAPLAIPGGPLDCNANSLVDACEIADNPALDCNTNGILDACEIAENPSLDCNLNSVLDYCEIRDDQFTTDQDFNSILDECENHKIEFTQFQITGTTEGAFTTTAGGFGDLFDGSTSFVNANSAGGSTSGGIVELGIDMQSYLGAQASIAALPSGRFNLELVVSGHASLSVSQPEFFVEARVSSAASVEWIAFSVSSRMRISKPGLGYTQDAALVFVPNKEYFLPIGPSAGVSVRLPDKTSDSFYFFDSASFEPLFSTPCRADSSGDGLLNFFDISQFLSWYSTGNLRADFDFTGDLNFFDVSRFLNEYTAGCP
jgi:hypothetical protein